MYEYTAIRFNSSRVWNHYAIVSDKESGYCNFYINGVFERHSTISNNYQNVNKIYFNYYNIDQKNTDLQCYIAQFALRAFPVWTENFTPPNYLY